MENSSKTKNKSERKLYQIPIEDFNLIGEKGKEVQNLLQNHNNLTYEEYVDVESALKERCKEGDFEAIRVLLNEEIEQNFMIFKINKNSKTASFIKVRKDFDELIIPRSINHDNENYMITSIIGVQACPKTIKTLRFAADSEVSTIYGDSFYSSQIEHLYLPPKLIELKSGWCNHIHHLVKIEVSQLNNNFIFKDNKYLLGKSDAKSDNFDVLLFASRNISEAKIPSNIKIISSYAFNCCNHLRKVEFSENSELQLIEKHAFSHTFIKQIFIPPHVLKIGEYAFCTCDNLSIINIPENSELQSIGKGAFIIAKIEEIFLPSKLVELKGGCFYNAKNLKKISISPLNNNFILKDGKLLIGKTDTRSDNFDNLVYSLPDIKEALIPTNIKIISSYAFHKCSQLIKVDIPKNSELQSIEKKAFSYTKIKQIFIPQHVLKIGKAAFDGCSNLTIVDIPENSELQSIENRAFSYARIKHLFIPPKLTKLGKRWLTYVSKLQGIKVSHSNHNFIIKDDKYLLGKTDLKSDNFDVLLYASCDIREAFIPSNIKIIAPFAFCGNKLTKVEIPSNSELQSIEEEAFSLATIKRIFIPPHVSKIGRSAFYNCKNLELIEIPYNSELQKIGNNAFGCTNINQIFIPKNVINISNSAFYSCKNLKIVDIPEDSELRYIGEFSFCITQISEIFFPSNLKKLENGWFRGAKQLKRIKVSPLNTDFVFKDDKYLLGKNDPKSDNFDVLLYAAYDIIESNIPSNIKIIAPLAFHNCDKMTKVEIPSNSELQSIEVDAFSSTHIKQIFIPPHVSKIERYAFKSCKSLEFVGIPENSELQIIKSYAFTSTRIKQMFIPPLVSVIEEYAFSSCYNMQIIEFAENSKLRYIDIAYFESSRKLILMIPVNMSYLVKYGR